MIYELRTYTLKPGAQSAYLKFNIELARPIRGDNYGTLVGCWSTDIGPLNQFVHLWSYPDPNERVRLRAELAKNERWAKEYVAQTREFIVNQETKLLSLLDLMPFTPPASGSHVYELRTYRMHPGTLGQYLQNSRPGLEVRRKYSSPIAFWQTEVGQLNQIVHLWPYDDLNHRARVRAQALADPAWQEMLAKNTPLFAEQHSAILVPTDASPLR